MTCAPVSLCLRAFKTQPRAFSRMPAGSSAQQLCKLHNRPSLPHACCIWPSCPVLSSAWPVSLCPIPSIIGQHFALY